jgi:hypothetical protein
MLAAIYDTSSSWGGNYRCGLCGTDLNRQWRQPNQVLHSSVRLSEEDEESTQVLYWILMWTYVACFFLNRSQYILIYTVYIIIYIFCSVGYTWLYMIVYVCLIIGVHSCFFVDDLANLEAEQDTESFKVLPASLGLRPRYTSWRNWLLSYECRRDMLYRAVNKSRHVQPLMITVRNAQKLWTSVTNSYFYTTSSQAACGSLRWFQKLWEKHGATWSLLWHGDISLLSPSPCPITALILNGPCGPLELEVARSKAKLCMYLDLSWS